MKKVQNIYTTEQFRSVIHLSTLSNSFVSGGLLLYLLPDDGLFRGDNGPTKPSR
jgi:hypothetical protein